MPVTPTVRGQFPTRTATETPLSRRERVVCFFVALACVAPPWLTGAWAESSQWTTLVLALMAFGALFAPMLDYRAWPPSPSARACWRRLRRFPIFWLGMAILGYGMVAALNPWKLFAVSNYESLLYNLSHVFWLPHGVEAPFAPMNAWRVLLMLAPAWLVICVVWVGQEAERPLRWLIGAVAANGALLAAVGMAQELDGTRKIFWFYDSTVEYVDAHFFAGFVYSNHAAAWLVLAVGAAIMMLDLRLRQRTQLEMKHPLSKSDLPLWLWLFALAVMIAALGEFVKPDFWMLAAGAVMGLYVWIWVGRLWCSGRRELAGWFAVPAAGFVALTLLTFTLGVWNWRQGGISGREFSINPVDPSLPVRYAIADASADMVQEAPLLGWGPGSYRYASRNFLLENPVFADLEIPRRLRYQPYFAYNDWVQLAVEWGLAGAGLFVAGIIWWLARTWRVRHTLPVEGWCVLAAGTCVFIGAMVDFPLQNPAVLICLGMLTAAVVKLGEISAPTRPVDENA